MGRHSPAVAELDRAEVGWLRAYAAELAAELPRVLHADPSEIWQWAGKAQYVLEELARG